MVHKSKHLRKFAAQGLSYVLRKMMNQFQQNASDKNEEEASRKQSSEVFDLICRPLFENKDGHLAQGISDLLFEIVYGAG